MCQGSKVWGASYYSLWCLSKEPARVRITTLNSPPPPIQEAQRTNKIIHYTFFVSKQFEMRESENHWQRTPLESREASASKKEELRQEYFYVCECLSETPKILWLGLEVGGREFQLRISAWRKNTELLRDGFYSTKQNTSLCNLYQIKTCFNRN